MNLTAPTTLALAWAVVPGLVVLVSAGLGAGLERLAGLRLGALLVPAGFLTGVALMTLALELGLSGVVTVGLTGLLALAGALWAWRRGELRPARPSLRASWVLPAGAALAAYAIGMAPLVGSGRSGVIGYVLSNDPAVHIATIELLARHGAQVVDPNGSSFTVVSIQFGGGYPLGSYVWPLLGTVATGVDAFHLWSPLIALSSAMTALAGYAILRRCAASPPLAAIGGTLAAVGYLQFSFLAQGGAKEVMLAAAVYGTVALFVLALGARLTPRTLLPAAVGLAAAIAIFGPGALTFLGPAALVACAIALTGTRERGRTLAALAGAAAIALTVSLPALVSSIRFTQASEQGTRDVNQVGNLLTAVPWREAFNVWLSADYRQPERAYGLVIDAAIVIVAVLAGFGLLTCLRRRNWAVPLAVVAGVSGAVLISSRYSIYFDAKSYAVLAPALGLATAAGVAALVSVARLRFAGLAVGALLALLVLASDALVYSGAWITPKGRFDELIDINERYAGQGRMLVNEREDYAKTMLRDVQPWESWGFWQPERGFRDGMIPPPPPHTPDFDDYRQDFMDDFRLLLERKRPGGSHPPSGFEVVEETQNYRIWRRTGDLAAVHVGVGAGDVSGTGALDCARPDVRELLSRRDGTLRYRTGPELVVQSPPKEWAKYFTVAPGPGPEYVFRRGGFAVVRPDLPPGTYGTYIQGQFGPGVRIYDGVNASGEARSDLGQQDQWLRVGTVRGGPEALVVVVGLAKPWWQAGSQKADLTGALAFVRQPENRQVREIPAGRGRTLCGTNLDWIERL